MTAWRLTPESPSKGAPLLLPALPGHVAPLLAAAAFSVALQGASCCCGDLWPSGVFTTSDAHAMLRMCCKPAGATQMPPHGADIDWAVGHHQRQLVQDTTTYSTVTTELHMCYVVGLLTTTCNLLYTSPPRSSRCWPRSTAAPCSRNFKGIRRAVLARVNLPG